MQDATELAAIFENGVLRPESELDLPEHSRVIIRIRRIDVSADDERAGRELFGKLVERHGIELNGWKPSREELHERD